MEVAQILLESGAATEIPANNLFTALHIAAKKNHLEMADGGGGGGGEEGVCVGGGESEFGDKEKLLSY